MGKDKMIRNEKMSHNISEQKSKYNEIIILAAFIFLPLAVYISMPLNNLIWGSADSFAWISQIKGWVKTDFSLWQKNYAGGFPVGTIFSSYPIAILLSWLPDNWFVYIYYCLHVSIGAFFFYRFLKEMKCTQTSALILGLIYMFSTHISGIRRGHMGIVTAICFMPAVMFFMQKYFNTKKLHWLILSAAPLALAMYGGHLQHALYLDIAVFFYLVIVSFKEKIRFRDIIGRGMAWGLTYIALISPKLIGRMISMREFSTENSDKVSFDYFASYSMHPIKALMSLFPELFGSPQAFGGGESTEVDFELFIGFALAIIIVFCAVRFIKEFYVKLSLFFMSAAMIYCVCPRIPYLKDIMYNMPLFGSFRCHSRALFIVLFFAYTMAAICLTRFEENEENAEQFRLFAKKVFMGLLAIVFIMSCSIITFAKLTGNNDIYNNGKQYLADAFLPSVLVTAIVLIVFYTVKKLSKKITYATLQKAAAVVIAGVTLWEVYPYTFYKQESSLAPKYNEPFTKLAESIGNYKAWDAFPWVDGGHKGVLTDHRLVDYDISSINTYTSLNNPDLYRYISGGEDNFRSNSSGLLIGSPNSKNMVKYQNNFMSMMGIKYVIDNYGIIDNKGSTYNIREGTELLYEYESQTVNVTDKGLGLLAIPIDIKPNSEYIISFKAAESSNADIVMDFCAMNYDNPEQEVQITDFGSEDSYSFTISSGDPSTAESQTNLRFFSYNGSEITEPVEILDLKIEKSKTTYQENVYVPFYITEDYKIYENVNARDVLYIPQAVEAIENEEYVFNNMLSLDLANISYIEGVESSAAAPAQISNIDFGNDRITADINAEGDTFVNFSQCWFTGWKAFVDGTEVPVHEVNGLIMGAYVPQGAHTIEFRFTAPYIIAAYILSGAVIIFWTAFFAVTRKKSAAAEINTENADDQESKE